MHSIYKIACFSLGFGLITACDPGEAATPRKAELSSFCGGIAGIECPKGEVCADDPNDDCDPNNGGADCGGICEPEGDKCDDPGRKYVSHDPQECMLVKFACPKGWSMFIDDCGCGCEEN